MAEAICARAERGEISIPLIPIICSIRARASRGVFAWTVVIEPSWPVFMACSMSKASPALTSPIMIRSGLMRSAFLTRSRCDTSPRPSRFGGRVSSRTTCSCWSCNSAESSIVTMRSRCSINEDNALSRVVLPEPVPPEIRTLRLAPTIARIRSDMAGEMLPNSSSRSIPIRCLANFRIERLDPSIASGAMIALTREPSAKRAST